MIKVLGIFVLLLFLTTSLSVFLDLLLGFPLYHAMFHLLNPFWVMEPGEYIMVIFLFLLTIGQQILFKIKKKPNKQNSSS